MLPKEMSYFVHKLTGCKRKTVRITPQGSQNLGMNSQVIFRLPENSIVDMNNFNIKFNFELLTTPSGTDKVMVPAAYKLWRNVQWRLNGQAVSLTNCADYNMVYHALKISTVGEDYVRSHKLQGESLLTCAGAGTTSNAFRIAYDDYLNATYPSRRMVCNDFLGLGGRCPNYIDQSIFGTLELTVQTAGEEIMKSQADSGTPAVGWRLTGLEATVDIVEVPREIDDLISANLSNGGTVELPFQDIYSTISPAGGSARFNVSTQSLDSLMWAAVPSGYNASEKLTSSAGVVATGATYEQNHFRFRLEPTSGTAATVSNGNNSTAYWRVQGDIVPSYGTLGALDWIQQTNDCVLGADTNRFNLLTAGCYDDGDVKYALEEYLKNNCVGIVDLTVSGAGYEGERVCSGIDTRNQSSQIELIMNNFYNGNYVLLAGICTSIIQAQAGQVITLIQ